MISNNSLITPVLSSIQIEEERITEEDLENESQQSFQYISEIISEEISVSESNIITDDQQDVKQIFEEYVGTFDNDIGSINLHDNAEFIEFEQFEEQIDEAHNLLRGEESIACSDFLEEIMHYLFLWILEYLQIDFESMKDDYEYNEIRDQMCKEFGISLDDEDEYANFIEQIQNMTPHFVGVGLLRFCYTIRPFSYGDGEENDNDIIYHNTDVFELICELLKQFPFSEEMFRMEPLSFLRSENRETIIDVINVLFYEESSLHGVLYEIGDQQRHLYLGEELLTNSEELESIDIMQCIESDNYTRIVVDYKNQPEKISCDLVGDIYEYVKYEYDSDESSELGQFFSSRIIVEFVIEFIVSENYINISNEQFDVADLSGGTAGFLTHFNNYANEINEADEIFYHFSELEPNTFMWGLMNMLYSLYESDVNINNINMFYNECDSLLEVNDSFYDLVLTNPPFGVSCLNYDDEYSDEEEEYVESTKEDAEDVGMELTESELQEVEFEEDIPGFETEFINFQEKLLSENPEHNVINPDDIFWDENENAEFRFIQLYVYELELNGVCAIVLPYGSMFFSSIHEEFRIEWMNRVTISDIIILPDGIFENTNVETCVVIFHETGFTENITFSELISSEEIYNVEIIFEISISELNEIYSLNFEDYLERKENISNELNLEKIITYEQLCNMHTDESIIDYYENEELRITQDFIDANECEIVKLGDVCELENGESEEEDDMKEGPYRMIGGGIKDVMCCDEFNIEGENILISGSGSVGHLQYIIDRAFINSDCTNIITKINKNYLYNVLEEKQTHILTLEKGSCLPHLDKEKFLEIEIPILSDDKLKELNTIYDDIDNIIYAIEQKEYANLKPQNISLDKLSQIEMYENEELRITQDFIDANECEIVKLSEICEIKSGYKLAYSNFITEEKTNYSLIQIENITNETDVELYITEDGKNAFKNNYAIVDTILLTTVATIGYSYIVKQKLYYTGNMVNIILKNKNLIVFMHHFFEFNKSKLQDLSNGSCQKQIPIIELLEFEIPLLSDNKLKELNMIYDKYDEMINILKTL